MAREELKITTEEYKEEFIATIVSYANKEDEDAMREMAIVEYGAYRESNGDDYVGDPESDAEECLSYWVE